MRDCLTGKLLIEQRILLLQSVDLSLGLGLSL